MIEGLEKKLVGEIQITSGGIIVLAPGDGKLFWFREIKDAVAVNSYPDVVQYKGMVLADMLTAQYSIFKARKSGTFITVEKVPFKYALSPDTILAFDRVLVCCDVHDIPWDLTCDRPYTTELQNGLYQVRFLEGNVLGIFPKR